MIWRQDSSGGIKREEWCAQNKEIVKQFLWKGGEGRSELVKDVEVLENAEAENLDHSHLCLLMDTICDWHAE